APNRWLGGQEINRIPPQATDTPKPGQLKTRLLKADVMWFGDAGFGDVWWTTEGGWAFNGYIDAYNGPAGGNVPWQWQTTRGGGQDVPASFLFGDGHVEMLTLREYTSQSQQWK